MFILVTPVAGLAHHLIERPARAAMRAWETRQTKRQVRIRFALRQA